MLRKASRIPLNLREIFNKFSEKYEALKQIKMTFFFKMENELLIYIKP